MSSRKETPLEYYNRRIHQLKTNCGFVPKRTRKAIIQFCRRMGPPSRMFDIPFCTGEVKETKPNTILTFPWTTSYPGQASPERAISKKKCSPNPKDSLGECVSLPLPVPLSVESSNEFKEGENDAASKEKKIALKGFPITPKLNLVSGESKRNEDGVLVTNLTTLDDEDFSSFNPITVLGCKRTIPVRKSHPRHRLKCHAMYFVRLRNVNNPLRFYMELIMKPPQDGCVSWDESLQKFYGDKDLATKYKMRTLIPLYGRMYVVYTEETAKWERVRVHAMKRMKSIAHVLYVDSLDISNDIPFDALHELHPKYGNWPTYFITAGMKDVRPLNFIKGVDDKKKVFDFSQKAIKYFQECAKDKLFRAFIVQRGVDSNDYVPHITKEDRCTVCIVYLFEVGAKFMIPVNAWMVQKGLVMPIKSLETCMTLIRTLHGLELEVELDNSSA